MDANRTPKKNSRKLRVIITFIVVIVIFAGLWSFDAAKMKIEPIIIVFLAGTMGNFLIISSIKGLIRGGTYYSIYGKSQLIAGWQLYFYSIMSIITAGLAWLVVWSFGSIFPAVLGGLLGILLGYLYQRYSMDPAVTRAFQSIPPTDPRSPKYKKGSEDINTSL